MLLVFSHFPLRKLKLTESKSVVKPDSEVFWFCSSYSWPLCMLSLSKAHLNVQWAFVINLDSCQCAVQNDTAVWLIRLNSLQGTPPSSSTPFSLGHPRWLGNLQPSSPTTETLLASVSVQPPLELTTLDLVTAHHPPSCLLFSGSAHFQSFSRIHPSFPVSNPLTSCLCRQRSSVTWAEGSSHHTLPWVPLPSTQQQSSLCEAQTVPRCPCQHWNSSPVLNDGGAPCEVLQEGLSDLSAALLAPFLASVPHLAFQPLNLAKRFSSLSPSSGPPSPLPTLSFHGWVSPPSSRLRVRTFPQQSAWLSVNNSGFNLFLHTLITIHDCLFSSDCLSNCEQHENHVCLSLHCLWCSNQWLVPGRYGWGLHG